MKTSDDIKRDAMGMLHNEIVHLIDASILEPPDVLFVLRLLIKNIEDLHEIALKGK